MISARPGFVLGGTDFNHLFRIVDYAQEIGRGLLAFDEPTNLLLSFTDLTLTAREMAALGVGLRNCATNKRSPEVQTLLLEKYEDLTADACDINLANKIKRKSELQPLPVADFRDLLVREILIARGDDYEEGRLFDDKKGLPIFYVALNPFENVFVIVGLAKKEDTVCIESFSILDEGEENLHWKMFRGSILVLGNSHL